MRATTVLALGALMLSGWAAFGVHVAKAASGQTQVDALSREVSQLAKANAQGGTAAAENIALRAQVQKLTAERDAWRKTAGKAYTAYLRSQDQEGGGAIPLPLGATFECAVDGAGVKHCDPSVIYPPKDF